MTFIASDTNVRTPYPSEAAPLPGPATATERELRAALAEKDLLLRDMHHRMKNDLQVVCSLLWLHASQVEDQTARALFRAGEQRVQSIALLHQKLAESTRPGYVDLLLYVDGLARTAMKTRGTTLSIALTVEGDSVMLPGEQALPCGLILNEFVANAQKHAFPHGYAKDAKVTIDVRGRDGLIEVVVADNGVGLPRGRRTPKNEGLGAQIARLLTDQLDGTLTVTSHDGTRCVLSFPALLAEG